ncbi:MAG: hypothetical protein E7350_04255 [Clostridiales bacterium]|nr:hypothetical protein [Clostridiales bacterium]
MAKAKAKKRQKTNKLGNLALIFSLIAPLVGIVLGILSIVIGAKGEDVVLRNDGIKAIILSVVVVAAEIALVITLVAVGIIVPFALIL